DRASDPGSAKSEGGEPTGLVEAHVHAGRIGVLLELSCENAAVAGSDELKALVRLLAKPIAGASPRYVSRADAPEDAEPSQDEVLREQVGTRDNGTRVTDLTEEAIVRAGGRISVRRFTRYESEGRGRGFPGPPLLPGEPPNPGPDDPGVENRAASANRDVLRRIEWCRRRAAARQCRPQRRDRPPARRRPPFPPRRAPRHEAPVLSGGGVAALFVLHGVVAGSAPSAAPAPQVGGCQVFPANNVWNTPITGLPVDGSSAAYVNSIGVASHLHPDFGSGLWN